MGRGVGGCVEEEGRFLAQLPGLRPPPLRGFLGLEPLTRPENIRLEKGQGPAPDSGLNKEGGPGAPGAFLGSPP